MRIVSISRISRNIHIHFSLSANGCNQWIDRHQMVLNGHRSIVNQVRYNGPRCFIASSGVEKVIKLWSPFAAPTWTGDLFENSAINIENARDVFTHDEYMSIINSSGMNVTHDYSNQNTTEDPRMMAFFDSLVQREIEGWNSDDENFESDDKSSAHSSDGSSRPTSTEEDSSNDSDDDDDSVANYLASNGKNDCELCLNYFNELYHPVRSCSM